MDCAQAKVKGLDIAALLAANPLVLAPLAGWTDLPFRLLTRAFGVGLAYTEMVSAEGLIRGDAKTWALVRSHPADAPLLVQLFGHDPDRMARAAALVEWAGFNGIDLNMGCPVTKITRQGAGGALMADPGRAGEIMTAVREAVGVTVTVKIRSGFTASQGLTGLETARLAQQAGLAMVCLHPRLTKQGFAGRADWSLFGPLAAELSIPLIGSGDIRSPADVRALLDTGCAGAMIGRAALGSPWIFSQAAALLAGQRYRPVDPEQMAKTIERHLNLLVHYLGEHQAWLKFKGLSGHYLKGLHGARLLRTAIHTSTGLDQVREMLAEYFERMTGER